MPSVKFLFCFFALIFTPVYAENHAAPEENHKEHSEHEEDHEEHSEREEGHTEHGKHVHGVADITIAMDKSNIEIMFDSPSYNIFGFGYKPTTDADKKIVINAEKVLLKGDDLFKFDESNACELKETEIESGVIKSLTQKVDKTDPAKKHTDVEVTWQFVCENTKDLKEIKTQLFAQFPENLEKLNISWITSSKTGKATLHKDGIITLQ